MSNDSCKATFSERDLMILGISQACATIVSTLSCILVLLIVVIFKKYTCQTQRVLIYLIVAILVLDISFIVRGFLYNEVKEGAYCSAIACFSQYGGGCVLLGVICFITDLLFGSINKNGSMQKRSISFDKIYIFIIFFCPILVDWIPFVQNAYGPTETWCWIKNTDPDTCDTFVFGLVLQYALWFVPLTIAVIIGSVMYVVAYCTTRKYANAVGGGLINTRHIQQDLEAEYKNYRWYPVVFVVFNGIPFLARIAVDIRPDSDIVFVLFVISGVLQGLQGSVIALIFSLDPSTRKRLGIRSIASAIRHNILNHDQIRDYPVINAESDSDYPHVTLSANPNDGEGLLSSKKKSLEVPFI